MSDFVWRTQNGSSKTTCFIYVSKMASKHIGSGQNIDECPEGDVSKPWPLTAKYMRSGGLKVSDVYCDDNFTDV